MFGLGVQELFFILLIVLIFFGAEKIPQLAKSLGKGMLEFKKAQQDLKKEILDETINDPPTRPDTDYVPMMTCPACQKETLAGSQFCSHCGKPLSPIKQCNSCHHQLTGNEKFCPGCGQALI